MMKSISFGIAALLATVTLTGEATAAGASGAVATMEPYRGAITESGGFTGDVAEGSPAAPVTIVEYASLSCPSCAWFHANIYPALKSQYIDTGKVRFILRDYPLNPPAFDAAVVARCGGERKYLELAHRFMSSQQYWLGATDWQERIGQIAVDTGLDPRRIDACRADGALFASINARRHGAVDAYGVNATPTLVIDGTPYDGPVSLEALSKLVDAKL